MSSRSPETSLGVTFSTRIRASVECGPSTSSGCFSQRYFISGPCVKMRVAKRRCTQKSPNVSIRNIEFPQHRIQPTPASQHNRCIAPRNTKIAVTVYLYDQSVELFRIQNPPQLVGSGGGLLLGSKFSIYSSAFLS
jgi:hypothetical protein